MPSSKSPNQVKMDQQEKMRRGELLGHLCPNDVRRRYVDNAEPAKKLAASLGISVIYLRRYCQAFGIHRDRGHIYRKGTVPKPKKGVRVPGSLRDIASRKPKAWSPEHREKLAAAKRGRTGKDANNYKGGHEIGGYAGASHNGRKVYEHRRVAESILGRPLESGEQVHHKDKNRKNNEPENLLVLSGSIHTRLHVAMRNDPLLDQVAWLRDNNFPFEELI